MKTVALSILVAVLMMHFSRHHELVTPDAATEVSVPTPPMPPMPPMAPAPPAPAWQVAQDGWEDGRPAPPVVRHKRRKIEIRTRSRQHESQPAPVAPEAPAAPAHAGSFEGIKPAPAWYTASNEEARARKDLRGMRTVRGRLSITEERAHTDAHQRLEALVADWLVPDVPRSWKTPTPSINAMVVDTYVEPTVKEITNDDLTTLYKAGLRADFSPGRRQQIVDQYHHQVGLHRMGVLGGGLAVVLAFLAALSSYIKVDEATKGYYTNRLRFLTVAALGGAAVLVYRMLV